MLQKLSKCEGKAWLCRNLIIFCHSDLTWNQANSNGQKISFVAIFEILNFDLRKFEQLSIPKFTKNSKFRASEIAKNDTFGPIESTKIWYHEKSEWR